MFFENKMSVTTNWIYETYNLFGWNYFKFTCIRGKVSGAGNSRNFGLLNVFKWSIRLNPFFGSCGNMLLPKFLSGKKFFICLKMFKNDLLGVYWIITSALGRTGLRVCALVILNVGAFLLLICILKLTYKSSNWRNPEKASSWIKFIWFPSRSLNEILRSKLM